MKTIFFTNRERIEIGDDHIQYMTYLQKKLPGANYDCDFGGGGKSESQDRTIVADTPIKKKRSQVTNAQQPNNKYRYLS